MKLGAVDAGVVDAALGQLVATLIGAFVGEDLVVDRPRYDPQLGIRDVLRRELGILAGRHLPVAGAGHQVGRHGQLPQPGLVHAEHLDEARRAMAKTARTRLSWTSSAGAASSGRALRICSGICRLSMKRRWKARNRSGLIRAPPTHSAVKPPCEWPAIPMRSGSTSVLHSGSLSRKEMSSETSSGRCQILLAR